MNLPSVSGFIFTFDKSQSEMPNDGFCCFFDEDVEIFIKSQKLLYF